MTRQRNNQEIMDSHVCLEVLVQYYRTRITVSILFFFRSVATIYTDTSPSLIVNLLVDLQYICTSFYLVPTALILYMCRSLFLPSAALYILAKVFPCSWTILPLSPV